MKAPGVQYHHSPELAAGLSLIPGLGHFYLGRKKKAAALFVLSPGLLFGLHLTGGSVVSFLLLPPYLLVMIPAALESYQLAKGEVSVISRSKPYIVLLLLTKGFWALPVLWQSHLFLKRSKVIWSVVVPTLAFLYFTFLFFFGRTLFEIIRPLLHQKLFH